jgi:hypothetical protein
MIRQLMADIVSLQNGANLLHTDCKEGFTGFSLSENSIPISYYLKKVKQKYVS